MKQFYSIGKLIIAMMIMGTAFVANAQNVIEEGKATVLEKGMVYEFTPSMTGTLTVKVSATPYFAWVNNGSFIYYGEECNDLQLVQKASYSTPEDKSCTDYIYKPMEKGTTYYVKQNYYDNNVTFTFTMSESATSEVLTSVAPSTAKVFNYITQADINILASAGISSIGKATLSYGNESLEMDPERFGVSLNGPSATQWIQIGGASFPNFKSYIKEIAQEGVKSFTITIENVEAGGLPVSGSDVDEPGITADNGTISVTYGIDVAPLYLPSKSTWPDLFYSYWSPGNPSALIKLAFDMNIASVGETKVVMGQVNPKSETQDDVYDEYPLTNINIEGYVVTIDLAGVERIGNKNTVTVEVANVVATNGMPVDMTEYGTTLTLFQYMSYSSEKAPGSSGVTSIEAVKGEDVIYNLNGIRVNKQNLTPGIYIINGKKVALK